MEAALTALKVFCLFWAIFWTSVNAARAMRETADIPSVNFACQALSTTAFIALQWLI